MTRTVGFPFIFAVSLMLAADCGSRRGNDAIDYGYELMSMQEQGWIDSTIMAAALNSRDDRIRDLAVRTCGIERDKRFASVVNSLCKESLPEISSAIFALGEIRDSSSINLLFTLLRSEDRSIRALAADALGKIGNRAAAGDLRSLLVTSGYDLPEIPLALWRLGDTLSIAALQKAAIDPNRRDAYGAAYALFSIAPDSSTAVFLNDIACIMKSDSSITADSAYSCDDLQAISARGLGDSKNTAAIAEAFDIDYSAISRNGRIELIRAMGKNKIGTERLEEILVRSDDSGIRRTIVEALGQIGDGRSFDLITEFTNDTSLQVRLAAISAASDVDKIKSLKILDDLSANSLWQIRAEVARSFGKIGTSPAEKKLRQMLSDDDDRVRLAVVESLGKYPIKRNLDIIKAAMFGSSDATVRAVAADVLGASKDPAAFDLLVEAAGRIDSSQTVDFCRSLVSALGNFVDSTEAGHSAIAAIMPFLNHHNRIVRQDAYAALGKFAPADFDPEKFNIDIDRKYYDFITGLQDRKPRARISTSRGEIVVEFDPQNAPRTVANFVKLANRKFYDGLTFHRVVQDFVIQGGCPRGDGWGDPGYTIREEINPIKFQKGTIGMATSGRDTGGSQFFICLSPQPHLDGRYTAFGRVVEGWDVVNKIEMGDTIYSVTIE